MSADNPIIRAITMLQDYKGDLARREFPDNDEGDHLQRVNENKRASVDAAIQGLRTTQLVDSSLRNALARLVEHDKSSDIRDGLPHCLELEDAVAVLGSTAQVGRSEVEPDGDCVESDGCPTELAVLKRFWREHSAKAAGHMVGAPLLSTAAQDVLAERNRQITAEGWTPAHDDEHACDEIAAFASFYAMPPAAREWDASSTGYGETLGEAIKPYDWHAKTGGRRRELVKAGALILAEIERLDRAAAKQAEQEQQP